MNDLGKNIKNIQMLDIWKKEEASLQEILMWVHQNARGVLWREYLHWKHQLKIPRGAKTIEAGCGYGKFSMLLGLTGEETTLLDYNVDTLKIALKAHRSINLIPDCAAGDLIELSHEMAGQFDVVCSFGTLEHFSGGYRRSAFQANARFLRPGGMLFFTVPNRFAVFYRIAFGLRRAVGLFPKDFYEEPFSAHELRSISLSSGVTPVAVDCVGTLKKDFQYWIMENVKSLLRKTLRMWKTRVEESFDLDLEQIDLSGAGIHSRNGYLDKKFSYTLLFVGQKDAQDDH
jgi:SAM-dependent methyltransferase